METRIQIDVLLTDREREAIARVAGAEGLAHREMAKGFLYAACAAAVEDALRNLEKGEANAPPSDK